MVQEPELAVVSMASAIGVIMESQQIRKLSHGRIGMFVIDRIGIVASSGPNAWGKRRLGAPLALSSPRSNLRSAALLMVEIAGE